MNSIHRRINQKKIQSLNRPVDNGAFSQDMAELDNIVNQSVGSPNKRGSHAVSGSTPDPESDDDVLQNAHQMGIAPDADLEHPTPLNIAKNIADAEESRRKDR